MDSVANDRFDMPSLIRFYLEIYPEENDAIETLIASLPETLFLMQNLTEMVSPKIHLTASAVLLTKNTEIFQIYHKGISKWLQPGGHSEAKDYNPYCTAFRELTEETGISEIIYIPVLSKNRLVPFDIDLHKIPENTKKNKREHWHFDFRYLFIIDDLCKIILQEEEVDNYRYCPINKLLSENPMDKLYIKLNQYDRRKNISPQAWVL